MTERLVITYHSEDVDELTYNLEVYENGSFEAYLSGRTFNGSRDSLSADRLVTRLWAAIRELDNEPLFMRVDHNGESRCDVADWHGELAKLRLRFG